MARERRTSRLDQPREAGRRRIMSTSNHDPDTFGRLSERIARFIGTGRFLVYMTVFVVIWLFWNIAARPLVFDDYPFVFLTLVLSLQASYAAPLILLAQNRQADRDRVQVDRDRDVNARTLADTEFLARELASVRLAVAELATEHDLAREIGRLTAEVEGLRRRLEVTAPPDGAG